jgi:AcrR family transcriptional regulator
VNADERVWGGTTLDARRQSRRERLLEVGFELLGGPDGAAAVTVRSVCRHAKLTDRYFYESFADREELLVAVYDRVGAEAREVLTDAVRAAVSGPATPEALARAAVLAFLGLLTGDPRKGRVLLLAPMSDPTLSARALALQPAFAELVRVQLACTDDPGTGMAEAGGGPGPDELAQRLTAFALIGALTQLFVRWVDGSLAVAADELTEYCVRLLTHAAHLARPPPPDPGRS